MDAESKREYEHRYYQANREKIRERARRWYAENRERAAASQRTRRESDPEKYRDQRHRSYVKARASGAEPKSRTREQQDRYNATQRSRYREDQTVAERRRQEARRWRRANLGRARESARDYSRQRRTLDPAGESDRFRHMKMVRLHGMRPEDWAALWDAQNGRCYLCKCDLSKLGPGQVHVEHDHRCCPRETSCSYCRRGLACFACNAIIGMAGDDPDRLRRIAGNLETALAAVAVRMAAKPEQLGLYDASAAAAVEALPAPRRLRAVADTEGR